MLVLSVHCRHATARFSLWALQQWGDSPGRAHFMGRNQGSHLGPLPRRAPCLFQCSALDILKFLIVSSSDSCAANEFALDTGAYHEQRRCQAATCRSCGHHPRPAVNLAAQKHLCPGQSGQRRTLGDGQFRGLVQTGRSGGAEPGCVPVVFVD